MTTDATMIKNLRAAQRAAGQAFADRLNDLVPAAEAVADLEARLRCAENAAGIRDPRPPAREMAVDCLHGRLGCLRPYLPFVTAESADRAQECLCAAPAKPKKEARR